MWFRSAVLGKMRVNRVREAFWGGINAHVVLLRNEWELYTLPVGVPDPSAQKDAHDPGLPGATPITVMALVVSVAALPLLELVSGAVLAPRSAKRFSALVRLKTGYNPPRRLLSTVKRHCSCCTCSSLGAFCTACRSCWYQS